MSFTPAEYRDKARKMRQLVEAMFNNERKQALLEVAQEYETFALEAEKLERPAK